jgi:dipeptide/tripeptide permease
MAEPLTTTSSQSDRGWFGHPRGLSTLFFTEMWERFSFYGLRALLVLYMTASVANGGLAFTSQKASGIVGWYGFGVYAAAIPGGWMPIACSASTAACSSEGSSSPWVTSAWHSPA